MSWPDQNAFIDNIYASSNLCPSFLWHLRHFGLLAERTKLEVPVLDLSITDAFDSEEGMKQLFLRLSFSQSSITRLIDHEGLTSAQELALAISVTHSKA